MGRQRYGRFSMEVITRELESPDDPIKIGYRRKAIVKAPSVSKTADYTAVAETDEVILVDTSGGSEITITLPSPSSAGAGRHFMVADVGGKAGTDNIWIVSSTGAFLGGGDQYVIFGDYAAVDFVSDGTNWMAS